MADTLMYTPIDVDDTQNYPFCKLQLVVETFWTLNKSTNQNSVKVPKDVKSRNKKTLGLE